MASVLNAIFDLHELRATPRIVYAFLVANRNPRDGKVSMTLEHMASSLGFTKAAVWSNLKKLEKNGYIRVEHNHYPVGNMYYVAPQEKQKVS